MDINKANAIALVCGLLLTACSSADRSPESRTDACLSCRQACASDTIACFDSCEEAGTGNCRSLCDVGQNTCDNACVACRDE